MNPRVSVIIPSFNYGHYLSEAINSVLYQTLPVHEIIVVDDGSTDNTEEIVRTFGDKVIYVRKENAGLSAARNTGIEHSTGDLIAFLDRGLLIEQWPVLRTLISRHIRHVWEETFPELAQATTTASPPPGTEHTGP